MQLLYDIANAGLLGLYLEICKWFEKSVLLLAHFAAFLLYLTMKEGNFWNSCCIMKFIIILIIHNVVNNKLLIHSKLRQVCYLYILFAYHLTNLVGTLSLKHIFCVNSKCNRIHFVQIILLLLYGCSLLFKLLLSIHLNFTKLFNC